MQTIDLDNQSKTLTHHILRLGYSLALRETQEANERHRVRQRAQAVANFPPPRFKVVEDEAS